MKIFDTRDIREIDEFTIHNEPISSIDLMERAAKGCAVWIAEYMPKLSKPIRIFTGPGNNGGDGWAIARLLNEKGYNNIQLYHLQISKIISKDSKYNRQLLLDQGKVPVSDIQQESDFPDIGSSDLIVDALFGSGLSRSPEGLSFALIKHLNASGAKILSIDIPSGLFGEDNSSNTESGIIRATHTLTFHFPKRAFFYAENEKYTGKWHVIPIGLHQSIISSKKVNFYYTLAEDIHIRPRHTFSHKGMNGHALLIAGSYGMLGAAILASRSCLRAGCGLLTTHIPAVAYPIVQNAVPESIYSMDTDQHRFTTVPSLEKYSAVGIGPGIGTANETATALVSLLKTCQKPLVLDADALNILAGKPELLALLPENAVLTPHPLEFDRLAGTCESGYQRNMKQIAFSKKWKVIVVLKGAYSSITLPDGSCYYNSTGNPGMATAGSGDVLTGMILSLLTQGYPAGEAAKISVFLHGLAGDLAVTDYGQHALIASDIIDKIGNAFNHIRNYEKTVF